jgi:hypothetical protein
MNAAAPRHFIASPGLNGAGLPQDRLAQMAARRAFVELKAVFIAAVAQMNDQRGDWLRQQIRGAEEPEDLWLLRAPVLSAMAGRSEETLRWRQDLHRGLTALFPDCEVNSSYSSLVTSLVTS